MFSPEDGIAVSEAVVSWLPCPFFMLQVTYHNWVRLSGLTRVLFNSSCPRQANVVYISECGYGSSLGSVWSDCLAMKLK